MQRFHHVLAITLALTLFPAATQGVDPPVATSTPLTPLMHMKLDRSKEILEGLTMDDLEKVARSARQLKLLSLESGWKVVQTPEYATQSQDFRRACDLIAEAAKEKDVSRATLGYVALTVRCVECHSYLRKNKIDLTKLTPIQQSPRQAAK